MLKEGKDALGMINQEHKQINTNSSEEDIYTKLQGATEEFDKGGCININKLRKDCGLPIIDGADSNFIKTK